MGVIKPRVLCKVMTKHSGAAFMTAGYTVGMLVLVTQALMVIQLRYSSLGAQSPVILLA